MPELFANLSSSVVRLIGVEPSQVGGLRSWIEVGAYVPSRNAESCEIELQNVTTSEIVPFLAFDFERFALASAESFLVARAEWDSYKLMSWPLLKLYYAAFFAAHAIMRSQGAGVVKIEKSQAKKLGDFLTMVTGESSTVSSGMYQHSFRTGTVGFAVMNMKRHGEGLGVHEGFWKDFCNFLNFRAERAVNIGTVDADDLVAGVAEVTSAIGGSTTSIGSWLSSTRNEINYQQKHSVWFPTRKNPRVNTALEGVRVAASSSLSLNIDARKEPIQAFVRTCHYLALVNIELADYLAARSTKGGAFGQKWRRLRATFP